jgi:hypothetical protein
VAVERVISGGQTGVDRAALDAARALGIPIGGWCPRGRLAEDGPIADRYPLDETASPEYPERTEWNVRDSDATLALTRGKASGGTAFSLRLAERYGRPCLALDLDRDPDPAEVRAWLEAAAVRVLNVAGPRESTAPGTYARARRFLARALRAARA